MGEFLVFFENHESMNHQPAFFQVLNGPHSLQKGHPVAGLAHCEANLYADSRCKIASNMHLM